MAMATDAERWGRLIRSGREGLFLTQAEFGERVTAIAAARGVDLTVDQSTVSRWENGQHAPSLRARPCVAAALDVDPAVLFQRAEAAA